ncbi:Murein DD-endopeptidase MepM [Pigmentiphaga humi]|uniref:Murein DD-endopeptidase MepM n=1 Tax=Pigmentiphaga humi TaxID=2478468 RepID=A0A3P4AZC5_9BURK|nr:M23 family metallopeptidase [Pigmentiphaga humi]VCU69424.1 Murein DD-endopeptidase MepM [Pigmentiphaga humi]
MNRKFSSIAGAVLKRISAAMQQVFSGITSHPATLTITSSPLKRRIVIGTGAAGLFVTAAAIGVAPLAPDAALLPTTRIVQSLELPDLAEQAVQQEAATPDFIREERVQRGDSVATLLNRLGVDDPELERFLRTSADARSFYQLYPGRVVQAATSAEGEIRWLRYIHTPGSETDGKVVSRMLQVERSAQGLAAREVQLDTERETRVAHGEITSSLFGATDAAGVPDSVATQIAEILSGDVDFHRDLRRGDHFNVVYEAYTHQGNYVRAGKVIALEFVHKGKPYQAVWFDQQPGVSGGYYTFDGKSLRKAFLRSPMEFTRVTSGFSMRLHPIHKTWRAHTGVDYGAPKGTPIRTTADGTIDFIGQQNGYGNVVVVRHHGQYSTLYAHMSAFAPGLTKGAHVSQGQMIGRVGSTGWATGPHLHYEFRIAGKPVDPLAVALPQAPELNARSLALFRQQTEPLQHQMALLAQLKDFSMPAGDTSLASSR